MKRFRNRALAIAVSFAMFMTCFAATTAVSFAEESGGDAFKVTCRYYDDPANYSTTDPVYESSYNWSDEEFKERFMTRSFEGGEYAFAKGPTIIKVDEGVTIEEIMYQLDIELDLSEESKEKILAQEWNSDGKRVEYGKETYEKYVGAESKFFPNATANDEQTNQEDAYDVPNAVIATKYGEQSAADMGDTTFATILGTITSEDKYAYEGSSGYRMMVGGTTKDGIPAGKPFCSGVCGLVFVKQFDEEVVQNAIEDDIPYAECIGAEDYDDIMAVKNAYDALTDEQKAEVGNVDTLNDAVLIADALKKAEDANAALKKAEESQKAAEEAAKTPGAAAIAAAEKAAADAQAAQQAAAAAKKAADEAKSGVKNTDEDVQKKLDDAVKAAETAQTNANNAVTKANEAMTKAKDANTQTVKTVTVNVKTVNASAVDKAVAAAGGSSKYVTTIVLGKKVKTIKKNSFNAYTKATTLEVKTKKLKKKSVKGSLKGTSVTTVKVKVGKAKANKKFVKKYKKIFTKKNAGKKVKVKK